MPHVRDVPRCQNLASFVRRDEINDLWRDHQNRTGEHQHLLVQLADLWRRVHYFGHRHVRQNGHHSAGSEVTDQPVRPLGELHVEAAAQDRCVNVDSKRFHLSHVAFYRGRTSALRRPLGDTVAQTARVGSSACWAADRDGPGCARDFYHARLQLALINEPEVRGSTGRSDEWRRSDTRDDRHWRSRRLTHSQSNRVARAVFRARRAPQPQAPAATPPIPDR